LSYPYPCTHPKRPRDLYPPRRTTPLVRLDAWQRRVLLGSDGFGDGAGGGAEKAKKKKKKFKVVSAGLFAQASAALASDPCRALRKVHPLRDAPEEKKTAAEGDAEEEGEGKDEEEKEAGGATLDQQRFDDAEFYHTQLKVGEKGTTARILQCK